MRLLSVVIIGAGAIGRGLLADLASAGGFKPIFVEANPSLALKLKRRGQYKIHLVGKKERVRSIDKYEVLTADNREVVAEAVKDCSFAVTAVGGKNLPKVSPLLVSGIKRRSVPLNILVCENWPEAEKVLSKDLAGQGLDKNYFSCVRCSVERMVRGVTNSLNLIAEKEETLYADRTAWIGKEPGIEGLIFCKNIEAYYARKLYTNNAGHALLGYRGAFSNCRFIYEGLKIPKIKNHLIDLLSVASQALIERYAIDKDAMQKHVISLLEYRFANRKLKDTVRRVAASPIRKLGPHERLTGLIRLLESCRLPTETVSAVIAAALHYQDTEDPESVRLNEMVTRKGVEYVLKTVCGFTRDQKCFDECFYFYNHP